MSTTPGATGSPLRPRRGRPALAPRRRTARARPSRRRRRARREHRPDARSHGARVEAWRPTWSARCVLELDGRRAPFGAGGSGALSPRCSTTSSRTHSGRPRTDTTVTVEARQTGAGAQAIVRDQGDGMTRRGEGPSLRPLLAGRLRRGRLGARPRDRPPARRARRRHDRAPRRAGGGLEAVAAFPLRLS